MDEVGQVGLDEGWKAEGQFEKTYDAGSDDDGGADLGEDVGETEKR